jgi:hypothetical protein
VSAAIRSTDRIAAILARDEQLIEVLVRASPAFARLRNGAMRRTFAHLVTVEQAARIARIDPDELVLTLNRALGREDVAATLSRVEPACAPLPAELLALPSDRIVDVDVREELRAGKEPFQRIMAAARALPPSAVLRVRAIFEPSPLYSVFAKKGFSHATERLGDEDFRVWFHRRGDPTVASTASESASIDADDVVVIDVRDLEPPEPMVRTLEALAVLPRGKTLVQLNVRVPQFLLPKLEERGFTYEVREQSADLVRLFIRHRAA